MNNSTTTSNGIGFMGILTIVFIVLKLTHVITWSWWWVIAPLWVPFVFFSIIAIFVGILYLWMNRQ